MEKSVTLRIRESIWYGRARNQPPPTDRELTLPLGGTFELAFHDDPFTFAITQINPEGIEITPLGAPPALVNDTGGIGPGHMAVPTRLSAGQRIKLNPWTVDASAIWEISVQEIQT
jgi:hypothetical protein